MSDMKPIKIDKDHEALVEAALRAVNGKAIAHTFQSFHEIEALATAAEKRLDGLGIPKAERAGARFSKRSGGKLPNAYKYSVNVTWVTLERRSSAWWLVEIHQTHVHPNTAPGGYLSLTQAQDAKAIEVLRRGYAIQRPKVETQPPGSVSETVPAQTMAEAYGEVFRRREAARLQREASV